MKIYLKALRRNDGKNPLTEGVYLGPWLTKLAGMAGELLKAIGHEVKIGDNMLKSSDAVKAADDWGADLYIALVGNEYETNAPLAWTCGQDPYAPSSVLCRLLVQEIAKAVPYARGENLRYPSTKTSLLVDHTVKCTSAVVKIGCCHKDGAEMYIEENSIAKAIAKAVQLYEQSRSGMSVIDVIEDDDNEIDEYEG